MIQNYSSLSASWHSFRSCGPDFCVKKLFVAAKFRHWALLKCGGINSWSRIVLRPRAVCLILVENDNTGNSSSKYSAVQYLNRIFAHAVTGIRWYRYRYSSTWVAKFSSSCARRPDSPAGESNSPAGRQWVGRASEFTMLQVPRHTLLLNLALNLLI